MSEIMKCFSQVEESPERQCSDPMKGIEISKYTTRDIVGPSGACGVFLRNKQARITLEAIAAREAKRALKNQTLAKNKEEEMENFRVKFWSGADDHILMSKIKGLVDIGMKKADEDLLEKKNKLKVALLEEEVSLTHEFIEKAQQSAHRIYQDKVALANQIEGRQKLERGKQAQEAYEKILKESSDEYRRMLFRENKRYCTKINEFQMKDKVLAQMKEKEEEQMWSYVMDKWERAKAEVLDYEKRQSVSKNYGHSDDILRKQLLGQRRTREFEQELKQEEMVFWKKMNEMFKEDEAIFQKRDAMAKMKRRQAILAQIEENKRNQKKAAEEELLFDLELRKQNAREIAEELAQIKDERMAERRELDTFKESVDQFKRNAQQDEKELEVLIAEEMKRIDLMRKINRDKAKKARETLMKEVYENRAKQVQDNKMKAETEKKERALLAEYSNFRWQQNDQLDKAKDKDVADMHEKHLASLMEQTTYEKELERRAAEENRNWIEQKKQQERELLEKSRILMNEPREGLRHPFLHAFRNC
ncbi:trichohyalin-like [Cimex lectularius]|uniref:Trichohyalin-plectin-homology domain-containing protein n=1 Tax=Cimex lectularius TaxID=79782 RepID=A0A8I6RGL4_CIMLE|nr:trichohyalin-like [Cimex lectularius]